jgi:hypothetical protein
VAALVMTLGPAGEAEAGGAWEGGVVGGVAVGGAWTERWGGGYAPRGPWQKSQVAGGTWNTYTQETR